MAYDYNLFGPSNAYDFGFFGEQDEDFLGRTQQPVNTDRFSRNRLPGLTPPEYDYGPMERYQKYLSSEPTRDQFKPSGFRKVLAGLSGGLESMSSGSIGRGAALGRNILDQPFENAYEQWQGRGKKTEAEARMADARFKNQMTSYDKQVDNANRERQIQDQEKNTQIRERTFEQRLREFEVSGLEVRPAGDGIYYQVDKQTGQAKPITTPDGKPITTEDIPVQKRIQMAEAEEQGRNQRSNNQIGATWRNVQFGQEQANSRLGKSLGQRQKELSYRTVNDAADRAVRGTKAPPIATPVNTRTAAGLIENKYPEFNDSRFTDAISVRGNQIKIRPDLADPDALGKYLLEKANGDRKLAAEWLKKWDSFEDDLLSFIPDEN